ncbi:MAG: hypothetical protein JSW58_06015 [Candidatus Latescibacterota bacterium]|nr:MAG: hypothetical protein JSW58_06015 [Candidatus Latescibacterota bacterium]
MRKSIVFAIFLTVVLGLCSAVRAQTLNADLLSRMAEQFSFFEVLDDKGDGIVRVMYADAREHVHVYKLDKGKAELEWEATTLGSRASGLFLADLEGDGTREIVIATAGGRILIYDATSYDLRWENLQDPFESIESMVAANIDGDPQAELIFIANSHLYIYDGLTKALEWQSRDEFDAKQMVVENVDDDEQLELITNTGVVFDTRFYNIEFESEIRFGERISLFDINGDGIPEVFGETPDFTLRIFDIYAERELW